MNTYDGHEGEDFQPGEDFDTDMITMTPPPPTRRWRPGRPVAVAGVTVVALASGAGIGYAATNSAAKPPAAAAVAAAAAPTPSASAVPAPPGRAGRMFRGRFPGGPARFVLGGAALGGIGGGVVHGVLTVPKSGGGYQTVDVQRGTVTAVSSTSVTVKSADGFTATYAVTSKSIIGAESAGIGSVKTGDMIFVTATVSGSTATAATVIDMTAIKDGRMSFGFPGPAEKAPVPAPQAPSA